MVPLVMYFAECSSPDIHQDDFCRYVHVHGTSSKEINNTCSGQVFCRVSVWPRRESKLVCSHNCVICSIKENASLKTIDKRVC